MFVSILNLFRNKKQEKAVRRSSMTIKEALVAARQAGRQTPDTGLFNEWVRVKGLSTRGSILTSRMQREYEEGFEERFQEVRMETGTVAGSEPKINRSATTAERGTRHRPSFQALNAAFLARVKAEEKKSAPVAVAIPDADQVAALYASGRACSLKEALVILEGGRSVNSTDSGDCPDSK